jgi:hypothetical protein
METIIETLKGKGVDLSNNRFLILQVYSFLIIIFIIIIIYITMQGEVEQIALMKPKGKGDGDRGLLVIFLHVKGLIFFSFTFNHFIL